MKYASSVMDSVMLKLSENWIMYIANKFVIIGAATGMKAALNGRIPTKVTNSSPSTPSTTIPTKTTLKARSTIFEDWQKDWTEEEKKKYLDSCGHIVPSRSQTPIDHCFH